MKRTSLGGHPCSLAHALDAVGEWWTPLVLRDVAYGIRRFNEIQEDLGVSANVLADRLATLVRAGILQPVTYQQRPERHEYALTEKGAELLPALLALMRWGDRWGWEDGARAPVRVVHEDCGGEVALELRCPRCEREVRPQELLALPGDPPAQAPGPGAPGRLSGARLHRVAGGVPLARSPRG